MCITMKVSQRIYGVILSVSIGLVMSLGMSLLMLIVNAGFVEGFFIIWMKSFAVGFIASLPISVTVIPFIQKQLPKVFKIK